MQLYQQQSNSISYALCVVPPSHHWDQTAGWSSRLQSSAFFLRVWCTSLLLWCKLIEIRDACLKYYDPVGAYSTVAFCVNNQPGTMQSNKQVTGKFTNLTPHHAIRFDHFLQCSKNNLCFSAFTHKFLIPSKHSFFNTSVKKCVMDKKKKTWISRFQL